MKMTKEPMGVSAILTDALARGWESQGGDTKVLYEKLDFISQHFYLESIEKIFQNRIENTEDIESEVNFLYQMAYLYSQILFSHSRESITTDSIMLARHDKRLIRFCRIYPCE